MAHAARQMRHEQEVDRVTREHGSERIEEIRQRVLAGAATHFSELPPANIP